MYCLNSFAKLKRFVIMEFVMPYSISLARQVSSICILSLLAACQPATETATNSTSQTATNGFTSDATITQNNQLSVGPSDQELLDQSLRATLNGQSGGLGLSAFMLPDSDNYSAIPQDPSNPITSAKIELGRMFFHDNRFALDGLSDQSPSWSCSTCHTVANGFKPGVPQGIGEGGVGLGTERRLSFGFDPLAGDEAINKPDMQPIAVPSILNVAYQEVVLWNGQLGNASNGLANSSLPNNIVVPDAFPSSVNSHQLAGIESQAIAGQTAHRLRFTENSPLQNLASYRTLWNAAYPGGSTDIAEDVGKAIAAFERTVYANQAPFQLWLRGDVNAMNESELAGANLFFGKAGCSGCHQGPALSSVQGASESELFFALGLADFDNNKVAIHGVIANGARLGRGGFTQDSSQNYQFKVPQLYNLADADVFGHGASLHSIKEVVEYKNKAAPQNAAALANIDFRFQPLNLSIREVNEITTFLTTGLYDPDLTRYLPAQLPQ